ncbi:hypothetical protein ARMGADRAFT_1088556 [Armillaria gallica]|uniref:Integrase core domain-containing protein n=1 Tax=Armillaria gallica TaxID=47427 RepID=A0A2H3D5G2_ARMGA|nr:hypothetical protein ARMGADRAFT_1088556 [Armillaria gallica]
MPNQHLPLVPAELILPRLKELWAYEGNMTDVVICEELNKVFDQSKYTLSSFKRMRKRLGFLSTRQQNHTVDSISQGMEDLRTRFPKAGYFKMKKGLRVDHNIRVSRETIKEWIHMEEPDLAARCMRKSLIRKVFYCAGINDLWCIDQHDKWKYRFGLCLHVCVDPFTGVIKWMKIWWNNSNPILICKYYLDVLERTGYGPLLTQSDLGNENGNVARAHTFLQQWADPDLHNTLQHRWMAEKKNIPPEIVWSVYRRTCSFGYESILQFGVEQGWYDPKIPLEVLVFRYIFIPWLQNELDEYIVKNNTTKKRHNRKVACPNRVPLLVEQAPERFDARDYKVAFSPESIATAWQIYAPKDHPVLKLVPDSFRQHTDLFMAELGHPRVTRERIWDIYLELLDRFRYHNIVALDEWDIFVDDTYDNAPEVNGNAIRQVPPFLLQGGPERVVPSGSGSEVDKSDQGDGEEETETEEDGLSGEAPILQMSAREFMRHLTNE